MLQGMNWYLEQAQVDDAYRLASLLVPFWMATGRTDDGDRWFSGALSPPAGSVASQARALYDHGYLAFFAGRYELAHERFAEACVQAEKVPDHDLIALALAGSARVALNEDVAIAVRILREALDVTAAMPESGGRSSALCWGWRCKCLVTWMGRAT